MTITFTYSTYHHIQGYEMHLLHEIGRIPLGFCAMADTDDWIERYKNLGYEVQFIDA